MNWQLLAFLPLAAMVVFLFQRKYRRAIIAGLVTFFVAVFFGGGPVPAKPAAKRNACIYNLRRLDEAKKGWVALKNPTNGAVPSLADLVEIDNGLRGAPKCPDGGYYSINDIGEPPTCTRSNLGHVLY